MASRAFPPAGRHGELEEVFEDIFFVSGSVRMPGPVPVSFSRNMVVLRNDGELTLVHSMRLDENGLRALEKLGTVKHVVRLAGFHGMDDPFYKDRYDAKVWAVKGQVYAPGFDNPKTRPEDGYFQADEYMDEGTALPIPNARLVTFDCIGGEGLLVLERDDGIVISGDAMQNWANADEFFNFPAKVMMKLMGFIKAHNIGPGWVKMTKPAPAEVAKILDLEFAHVLPVHGSPVRGEAKAKFRPAIEAITG